MRRLISLCLFAAIVLPFLAPALSMGALGEVGLPACCRRDGAHRCGMVGGMAGGIAGMGITAAADGERRVQGPRDVCPYQQRGLVVAHHEVSASPVGARAAMAVLQEASGLARVECLRRISFDRSRQKRGPPSLLS